MTVYVANGEHRPVVIEDKTVIAVDGGLQFCHDNNIQPSAIVGDFDSIPEGLLELYLGVKKIEMDRAKDQTDLEAAIEEYGQDAIVYGGLGKRLDHSVYNLFLALRNAGKLFFDYLGETISVKEGGSSEFYEGYEIVIENGQGKFATILEQIFQVPQVTPGKPMVITTKPGQTISLYPLGGRATGVQTKRLKWELGGDYNYLDKDFVSLSNVAKGESIEISVAAGKVAVFVSEFIDEEMLGLEDHTSTSVLTSEVF